MIVRELITQLGFEVDENKLKAFDAQINSAKKGLGALADRAMSIGRSMSLLVTAPVALAGASALKTSAEFEKLNSTFTMFLGNAEEAKVLVKNLTDFAAQTPFQIGEVFKSASDLLNANFNKNEIIPVLRAFGDITASSSAPDALGRLIYAVSQIKGTGKLMQTELRQINEIGIGAAFKEALSAVTGFTPQQISEDVGRLGITSQQAEQALMSLATNGGKYMGNMERQSQTLGGQFSNLLDEIKKLKLEFGDLISDDAKTVIGFFKNMINYIRKINPELKKMIVYFLIFAAILGPVIILLASCVKSILAIKALSLFLDLFSVSLSSVLIKFGLWAAVAALLALALHDVWAYFNDPTAETLTGKIVENAKNAWKWFKMWRTELKINFLSALDSVWEYFSILGELISSAFKDPLGTIKALYEGEFTAITDSIENKFKQSITNIFKLFFQLFSSIAKLSNFIGPGAIISGKINDAATRFSSDLFGTQTPAQMLESFGRTENTVPNLGVNPNFVGPQAPTGPVSVNQNFNINVKETPASAEDIARATKTAVTQEIQKMARQIDRSLRGSEVV